MRTIFASRARGGLSAALALLSILFVTPAGAQPADGADPHRPAAPKGPQPFGANLFLGNFRGQAEEGRNPSYAIMPGDRVQVNTWGAVEINRIFVVDGQGNIFLPSIGPVRLQGVRNRDLTRVVKAAIATIFRSHFGVYTNLLTTAPVAVYVTGGVVRPGSYAGVPSDSVLFFLDQAGGIEPGAGSYRDITILRGGKTLVDIDLYDFLLGGKIPSVQFTDGDTVLVKRRGPVVEVRGEVPNAGLVEMKKEQFTGQDVLDVMTAAARATAVTVEGTRRHVPFVRTMPTAEFRTTTLHDGDAISFRVDGKPENILINLEGEFDGPSVLSVRRGARLVDVLNYVHVDPTLADVASIHLRRPSVAAAQKKAIEDSLFRLERSSMLALSATDREAAIRAKEAELMKSFIESARTVQPLGRIVTSYHGKQLNLMLEAGDTIVIPAKSSVVRVDGEVQMAHALVYSDRLRARDYVRMAGGYTDRSDHDKVIIMHSSAAISMGGPDMRVRPGDEILVPPRVDRKLLQNAADVTQVIYQIAVAAAVVLAI